MSKKKVQPKGLIFNDNHLTKQDHGGTADINYIAQQYAQGRLPYPDVPPPFYGDISSVDVQEARNTVAIVNSYFDALPSDARDFFANDSRAYVDWLCENAERIDKEGIQDALWETVNPDPSVSPETNSRAKPGAESSKPAPESTVDPT